MAERKVALVTGAGGHGIGRAIAEMLAAQGHDIMLHCGRSLEPGEAFCAEIREKYGVEAYAVQADFEDKDAYKKVFAAFDEKFKRLDVFVNNAGVTIHQALTKLEDETFDKLCTINYRSCVFSVQNAALRMIANDIPGKIVVITSIQGMIVYPMSTVYGSIKAGLIHFVRHAAMELAQYGINLNGLAPGPVLTDRRGPIGDAERERAIENGKKVPLGAWPETQDIANGVKFLISDDAKFITGHNLAVESGMFSQYYSNGRFEQPLPDLSAFKM